MNEDNSLDILKKKTHMTLLNCENIGQDTLNELKIQKEKLTKTEDNVIKTKNDLSIADRFISNMKRFWRN
jgi:hypothetical protein